VQCSLISAESAAVTELCTGVKLVMSRSRYYSVAARSHTASEQSGLMVRETSIDICPVFDVSSRIEMG